MKSRFLKPVMMVMVLLFFSSLGFSGPEKCSPKSALCFGKFIYSEKAWLPLFGPISF